MDCSRRSLYHQVIEHQWYVLYWPTWKAHSTLQRCGLVSTECPRVLATLHYRVLTLGCEECLGIFCPLDLPELTNGLSAFMN